MIGYRSVKIYFYIKKAQECKNLFLQKNVGTNSIRAGKEFYQMLRQLELPKHHRNVTLLEVKI